MIKNRWKDKKSKIKNRRLKIKIKNQELVFHIVANWKLKIDNDRKFKKSKIKNLYFILLLQIENRYFKIENQIKNRRSKIENHKSVFQRKYCHIWCSINTRCCTSIKTWYLEKQRHDDTWFLYSHCDWMWRYHWQTYSSSPKMITQADRWWNSCAW